MAGGDPWEQLRLARERTWRASEALTVAGVVHAVIGSHAVDYWVNRQTGGHGRFSCNSDVLLARPDWKHGRDVLAANDAHQIRLYFAGEQPEGWRARLPPLADVHPDGNRRVIGLDTLVWMKAESSRLLDSVHLRDMIDDGVIDRTWPSRFAPAVAALLQHLLDTPNG